MIRRRRVRIDTALGVVKLLAPPTFLRDLQFRELSHTEGKNIYRFQTLRHIRFPISGLVADRSVITFHDASGRVWLQIDRFGALIPEGYAWNGCSPKRWLPLLGWVGTPDFRETLAASLLHDALYQFHATRHFPLHRSDCDQLFHDLIAAVGSEEIAGIYYTAVRRFGHWSPTPDSGEFSTLHL